MTKNKEEIKQLLEEEIASRYYFQKGRIEAALAHDLELKKALEVLSNTTLYSGILNGTMKADAGDLKK